MNDMTLANLGGGAAEELFAAELSAVLANIDDPNTDAEAKRTITLTVVFEPEGNRREAKVRIGCKSRLAATLPHALTVGIGMDQGKLVARPHLSQELLFPNPTGQPAPVSREA